MTSVYLTIDDAPSRDLPAKLAVLQDADVPALLFCEGRRLAAFSDRAREAIEAGVHLGNHGYSHTHASDLDVETFRAEVERTERLLEDCYAEAGVDRPALVFRFPYGDKGGDEREAFQAVLAEFGFRPPRREEITYPWYSEEFGGDVDWRWTVDFNDWTVDTAAGLAAEIEAVADRLAADSPDIVLFHDGGNAPELLETCIRELRDRGARFADPLELVD